MLHIRTHHIATPSLPCLWRAQVVELRATYDHDRSATPGGKKVKGNLHWVSGSSPGALPATAEVRLYDHLFTTDEPGASGDWEAEINPASEVVLSVSGG